MTPFGAKLRELRKSRNLTLAEMAKSIGVSSAYLSALEHGKRGRPSWHLVQGIIAYLNIIWDEAEELIKLSRVSHPRIAIDTSGLEPQATELANQLSRSIAKLDPNTIRQMLELLKANLK